MVPRRLLLPLVLLLVSAAPVRAGELWASEDGDWAWEGWGYLKSQSLGMHFRDIALYPENSGAMHSARVRLATDLYFREARLSLEHELSFDVVTSGLEGDMGIGGFGTTTAGRPRLWDIDDVEGSGLTLTNNLDRLWFYVPIGPVDLRVGRQAISWGSAWFWKPTDRFSPFSPMDIDPDVKRGVDAVRAEIFFGRATSLDLVATFERHADTDRELWVHGGMRFRTNVGRYDLAVSAARFQFTKEANYMGGIEFTGELGDVGFRGEAAFNWFDESEEWDVEAVLGADYHFSCGLTLAGEFFYNGFGTGDPDDYLDYFPPPDLSALPPAMAAEVAALLSPSDSPRVERLARGETFNIGRFYAGIAATQEITPLIHLSLSAIGNLEEP